MGFFYRKAIRLFPKSFRERIKMGMAKRISERGLSGFANLLEDIMTMKMVQKFDRISHSLKGKKGLKVHLGCGGFIKQGWVNIDSSIRHPSDTDCAAGRDTVLIEYDLRYGLPLDEGSCDYIYSSHFFEHLSNEEGFQLMRECYLKLRPGGIFRIALPTFREGMEAYIRGDYGKWYLVEKHIPEIVPGMRIPVDYINTSVYQFGKHKCIYDEESTISILQSLGFSSTALSSYKEGMDPDSEVRRKYSFYVEAVK
jgi:predicted SAM-dependent methyltransferase